MVQETDTTTVTEETQETEATPLKEVLPTEAPVEPVPEVEPDSESAPVQDEVTEDSLRELHPDIFSALSTRHEEETTTARKKGNADAQTRLQGMVARHNDGVTAANLALTDTIPAELRKMAEGAGWTRSDVNDLLNGFQSELGGMFRLSTEQGVFTGVSQLLASRMGDDRTGITDMGDRFQAIHRGEDTIDSIVTDWFDNHDDAIRKDERTKWEVKLKTAEGKLAAGARDNREGEGANTSTATAGGGGGAYRSLTSDQRRELQNKGQADDYIDKHG